MNPFRRKDRVTAVAPGTAERRGAADPRKQARPLMTDAAVSPFLADHTRGGLTDRFAEVERRRGDWVLVSVGLMACLLVSLGMNAYQAVRTNLIPFKVVVDGDDGYLLDSGPLEPMENIEGLYIRRELREVITGLRTVTADRAATRGQFDRAWNRVIEDSEAYTYLVDYYSRPENDLNALIGQGQRTVVEFVGPTKLEGTDTWTFQWAERTARPGSGVTEDTYRGSMTVDVRTVSDLATAERNPLGVWITGIQWEKVSTNILNLQDLEGGSPLDLLYPDQPSRPAARPAGEAPGTTSGATPSSPAPSGLATGAAGTAPAAAPPETSPGGGVSPPADPAPAAPSPAP